MVRAYITATIVALIAAACISPLFSTRFLGKLRSHGSQEDASRLKVAKPRSESLTQSNVQVQAMQEDTAGSEKAMLSTDCSGQAGSYENCVDSWSTKCCPGGHRCRSESKHFGKDCNIMFDSSCKCVPTDVQTFNNVMEQKGQAERAMDLSSTDPNFRRLHAHRIPCPIMSSFYRKGWLNPDQLGRIERHDLYNALAQSGDSASHVIFQTLGIASYDENDPEQMQRLRLPDWSSTGSKRYLNIFRMNPGDFVHSEQVQHGCSTIITDARYDGISKPILSQPGLGTVFTPGASELSDPEAEVQRVRALRKQRFDQWILAPGVLSSGRMYSDGLATLISYMKDQGDRSGEWSSTNIERLHPKAFAQGHASELSEWQPELAWTAVLTGFGRQDSKGYYVTQQDLESLFLDSEFPADWYKREYGFTIQDSDMMAGFGNGHPTLMYPGWIRDHVQKNLQSSPDKDAEDVTIQFNALFVYTMHLLGFDADGPN